MKLFDNRKNPSYHPQVRDIAVGEFFEWEEEIWLKVGSNKKLGGHCFCYNLTSNTMEPFIGTEVVDCILNNVNIFIEDN